MARKGQSRKGGLYKDKKSGVWRFRVQINGKRVTKSTGETDRRKAEARRRELMEHFARRENDALLSDVRHHLEQSAQQSSGHPLEGRVRIREAWEKYPYTHTQNGERHELNRSTITDNYSHWKVFIGWANTQGLTYLDEVTEEHGRQFDAFLGNSKRSGNRINKIIGTCRVVFRLAGIRPNPFANVTRRGHISTPRQALSMQDLERLVNAADWEMKLLLVQGMYTGGRLGAVIHRKWGEHVDPDLGYVRNEETKTAKHRASEIRYVIHPYLRETLAQVPREQRTGYVCPALAREYDHDRALISRRMNRLLERCEISQYADQTSASGRQQPVIGFHSLRHTVATWMAENGVPQAVAEAMLGHNNSYIHRIYVHVGSKAINSAVESLPSIGGNNTSPQSPQDQVADLLRHQTADNWQQVRDQAISLLTDQ